ncbi:MAG: hypothetical protein IKI63_01500 [Clostridia bacterium]|nr:hypothetical protein [Clostridia bacterium]
MKWTCNTCAERVKGDVCPGCGAILPDPATTPATERMHRALRSAPFVLAVIFFTLALLLNIASDLLPHQLISVEKAHQAIVTFEQGTGLTVPENIRTALDKAIENTEPNASDVVSKYLLSAIACLGLWLLVGTGFRSGRIGRSGAVVLKVITIMELVGVCLGMAAVAGLAVSLVFGRDWLLSLFADTKGLEGLLRAIRDLIALPAYEVTVWAVAGGVLVSLLIGLFFLIGAIRTENEVIRVSRFGQGRKVSVFLCVMLFISTASTLGSSVDVWLARDWMSGAILLLSGLAMLLFGITILRYRHWSKELLWSDVHPEAVEKAIAAIPTELNTADLLGEPEPAPSALEEPKEAPRVFEPEEPEEPEQPELPEEPEPPAAAAPDQAVNDFIASTRASAPATPVKPASSASTVCPHCGAVMKGKAFFCEECGQLL